MRKVKVYINDAQKDTQEKWGILFADGSLSTLMTPAPLKSYITNKSALSTGKQVLTASGTLPKVDERDFQLTFGLHARNFAEFITRYRAFVAELQKGAFTLTVHMQDGETFLKETYYLLYLSCSQYSEYNGRLAKFVLKVNEPDPAARVTAASEDITL